MLDGPTPTAVRLSDYRAPDYRIETTDLTFRLHPEATTVLARIHFVRQTAMPVAKLVLPGEDLELRDVRIDGVTLTEDAYSVTDEGLELQRPPERFTLETVVRINPDANTQLMGLYRSNGIYCTQCEAQGFRRITYYLDRPDVLARFRVRLEGQKATLPVLLSNGNLVSSGEFGDGGHFAVWEDPFPKPSYLFAIVAGDLAVLSDRYRTASGRHVALNIYTEPAFIAQCRHAMDSLKRSMRWDEQRFRLEYDLDVYNIVAVSDFNMGAMENKGLNVFNTSATLARQDTSTDGDFVSVERVIAHEYFHNWTGNRVTCRDWFQLTLKEGLTVFRDQEYTADLIDREVKRIGDVALLREGQFTEDAGPMAHPIRPDSYVEINNFYTRTVYEKGAEVIRMLHTLIGEDVFQRGMDIYFERHDGDAVTCEDFVDAMATASGRNFDQFFRWYRQAGTPKVTVASDYNTDAKRFTLTVRQETPPTPGQPEKAPLHFPFEIGLLAADGSEMLLKLAGDKPGMSLLKSTSRVLEIDAAENVFVFEGVDERPVPSLLRNFTAPVRLDAELSDAELTHLLTHDRDGFARWDAGQTLSVRVLLALVSAHRDGLELNTPSSYLDAVAAVLADTRVEPAYKAQLLGLPSATYLGEQMQVIDVDGIAAARQAVQSAIGTTLGDALDDLRAAMTDNQFAVDAMSMGRRRLKNTCLAMRCHGDPEAVRMTVLAQVREADNMTDQLAALALVARYDWPERQATLDWFFGRWQSEPLVLNKWFAVQAMADRDRAVEDVQALLRHPAFTLANPNRVRSVVGVFAAGNPIAFHRRDGAGYRLVADVIAELDKRNPQVSARLGTLFGRWQRYDAERQRLMRAELDHLAALPDLSRDLFEIVRKSLGAAEDANGA